MFWNADKNWSLHIFLISKSTQNREFDLSFQYRKEKSILSFSVRKRRHSQTFPKFSNYKVCYVFTISSKQVRDEVFFCMQTNIQVSIYFITFGVNVSYQLILSLLVGIIKDPQNIQINKFAISLQHLKREVREGVQFLNLDNHQSF